MDSARFFRQYETAFGNYAGDRHRWLGEESARTLHEQASELAANGNLPRRANAKLLTPGMGNQAPKPEEWYHAIASPGRIASLQEFLHILHTAKP